MTLTINPNRIELDEAYMQMAEIWAKRSKANRKQVGALIVKDRQIISDGYNGMPANDPDDVCEFVHGGEIRTKPEVLHAESNALAKISKHGGVGAQGATLYVTMSPCFECAKLIKQAGVERVVYREHYRDASGIKFLRERSVQVDQLGAGSPEVPAPKPAPVPVPPPRPVAPPPVRAAPVPVAPPVAPVIPPAPPAVAPLNSEDEVAKLLAEWEASQERAAKASALGAPTPAAPVDDRPGYRSSFL